jgi:hypothetical protein
MGSGELEHDIEHVAGGRSERWYAVRWQHPRSGAVDIEQAGALILGAVVVRRVAMGRFHTGGSARYCSTELGPKQNLNEFPNIHTDPNL